MRNVLTNCLGGSAEDVDVDFSHCRLQDRDQLLFCTDGLSEMVPDEEIATTLAQSTGPQEACQALVDLALEHGGKDNVTVVLASFTLARGD